MTNCQPNTTQCPAAEPLLVPAQRLMTMEEVAHLLSISKPTAERLHAAGKLPTPIRLGRKLIRWDLAELNEWLTRRKRSGDLYDRAEWHAIREAAGRSLGRS